jgi:hypothetical protein
MIPLPFSRSYWVIPGRFLAGCYPGGREPADAAVKIRALFDTGVTLCVSLMFADERDHTGSPFNDYCAPILALAQARGRRMRCLRYPIVDGSITTVENMAVILDAIAAELDAGGVVYVHCWGGRGRTGTVVACWLIRNGIATGETAVDWLQGLVAHNHAAFHPTPENQRQRAFVRNF